MQLLLLSALFLRAGCLRDAREQHPGAGVAMANAATRAGSRLAKPRLVRHAARRLSNIEMVLHKTYGPGSRTSYKQMLKNRLLEDVKNGTPLDHLFKGGIPDFLLADVKKALEWSYQHSRHYKVLPKNRLLEYQARNARVLARGGGLLLTGVGAVGAGAGATLGGAMHGFGMQGSWDVLEENGEDGVDGRLADSTRLEQPLQEQLDELLGRATPETEPEVRKVAEGLAQAPSTQGSHQLASLTGVPRDALLSKVFQATMRAVPGIDRKLLTQRAAEIQAGNYEPQAVDDLLQEAVLLSSLTTEEQEVLGASEGPATIEQQDMDMMEELE
ncbi:unnamed protein product [Symbiodinium natans]|uniref:Uncharacterized protein n=1 Tax=Symbiodinium natans TaxID=878477 RepID=A0A812G6F6_9DINO|nr:unnamed protein product [Symbiodinium natans]